MKIAIFHNFLDNIGGAEIVVLTLARELSADVYTTNIDREKIKKMGFEDVKIISIAKVPIMAPFKHQMSQIAFRKLNLGNKYDKYIIAGDWALSGAINHKPNIWYIHSPMRELYDLYDYVKKEMVPWYGRPAFILWAIYNRYLVNKYKKHVGKFVCNSKNTQNRIKKYLNEGAEIIYPPVNTKEFNNKNPEGYWLSVNRLFPIKRVEMQLEAFKNLPEEKLIIVGSYEQTKHFTDYAKYILDNKPDNVEIRSWVNREELIDLYSKCKGFITTPIDEDFGMTAVEAMASGKFVIAPNEGGYKESVLDGKTGVLIDDINAKKIFDAVKSFDGPIKYKKDCLERSKKFDDKEFIDQIKNSLNKI